MASPPQLPDNPPSGASSAMIIMPIITGSGSLMMSITLGHRPLMAAVGAIVMLASVVVGIIMFVSQHNGPRRQIRDQRERYIDYLDQLRDKVRDVAATQRAGNLFKYPAPHLLTDTARLPARRWERRSSDPDFLHVRVGEGTRPLARRLTLKVDKSSPLVVYDPICEGMAQQLVDLYAQVPEEPLVVPLRDIGVLSISGDRAQTRDLARSMVAQIATFSAAEDVCVGVVRNERLVDEWDWTKWLPHNSTEGFDDEPTDGPLPARLVTKNTVQMQDMLEAEIEKRTVDMQRRRGAAPGPGTQRIVVVVDGEYQSTLAGLAAEPPVESLAQIGIHVILLVGDQREEPEVVNMRLTVSEDRVQEDTDKPVRSPRSREKATPVEGRPDSLSVARMTVLARILAPYRLSAADSADTLYASVDLPEIIGVPDVAQLDVRSTWKPRNSGDFLRVPIGVGPSNNLVLLDLKESAFGGMGPHGLVVGATGSGKSEMLRTLVTSLVVAHPPERLAMLLVDFKGGATFADTDRLPHSAGIITNLADDESMVARFREAMYGELSRRQQVLKEAGNLPNVHAYEELRADGREDLEPLPHLLVIIDEFSELLTAHPDFAELFLAIGRIGRSIGVHLMLATQKLESGKIKGLESHLSFRISLRTFSEQESREAIGVGDAYHLPPEPGSGYLKVDTSVFERFKAAMVSSPYTPPDENVEQEDPVLPLISYNGVANADPTALTERIKEFFDSRAGSKGQNPKAKSVLQVAVDRIVESGAEQVRPVWLPPLETALPLDTVLDWNGSQTGANDEVVEPPPEELKAQVGIKDLPREQAQETAELDFTGAGGNMIVLGGPRSGKSLFLRTLIASLAWRYPPGRVAVYAIDFGGGGLSVMEDLPHVAGVAGRADPEKVRRVMTDVRTQLDRRERVFRRYKLESPEALRRARAEGKIPNNVPGDVFLMIDGWSQVRELLGDTDDELLDILNRGSALGVHTLVTGTHGNQVRSKLQSLFGARLEFRLTEPNNSGIDRHAARDMPKDLPGRALMEDLSLSQVALPRLDGTASLESLSDGHKALVERIRERWPEGAVSEVRTLPNEVKLEEVLRGGRPSKNMDLVLGLGEQELAPALLRAEKDPHLVVFGDPETGKSTLLRGLIKQLAKRPAKKVGVIMVDYRRTHLGLLQDERSLAYCTTPDHTKAIASQLAEQLKERIPGPDVTPKQLRARSWWQGREIFMIVDDLDMLGSRQANPLLPLVPLIPQGRDLGFHLIVARRTGGSGRAMFEPPLQTLNDMASTAVMFSGDRREGRLANGVASRQLQPGRALLVRRGTPAEQLQAPWSEPPA
ncbi:type VII secretion protein EccCa [Nocardiopsis coralli]|uniref:type VII secretion protein EccCa n=1 Tax=Nocardiopsis coralli TaxID=2772213 RepID=UPI0038B36BFC